MMSDFHKDKSSKRKPESTATKAVGLKRQRKLHDMSESDSDETPDVSIFNDDSFTDSQSDVVKPHHADKHQHVQKTSPKNAGQFETVKKDSKLKILSPTFGFYLTKVTGIPSHFNESNSMSIKDILNTKYGKLKASAQFSYQIDVPWLLEQYPQEFKCTPILIIHGDQRESKRKLEKDGAPFKNVSFCQAKLEIMYGTHHTKMMLLLYEDGMRVVIHTANLVQMDWYQKTQGIWFSPKFPKLSDNQGGDSPTNFKADLLLYLQAYNKPELNQWLKHIKDHDMSSAKVYIIGSVPGRHTGSQKDLFGHLKLRKVLARNSPTKEVSMDWEIVGQFSSIGSLGANPNNWLCGEWLESLSATKALPPRKYPLKLIFPTVDNVRTSLEGYPAGVSLPYSIQVAGKQMYLRNYLHQWKSDQRGRSCASPHIKTYTRVSQDLKYIAWFLVTSANLSKAAWGAFEKNGTQLMIRSYELGVLFMPNNYADVNYFSNSKKSDNFFDIPYDLPLTPYKKSDEHWIWNIPHTKAPDCNGNMWCPPPL